MRPGMEMEMMLRPPSSDLPEYPPKYITLANGEKMVIRQIRRDEIPTLMEAIVPLIQVEKDFYDIDTCGPGSTYDTILQVRQDHCRLGPTIDCNDDNCGVQAGLVEVWLNAGTQYFVIVDGYWTGGQYELRIQPAVTCPAGGSCAGTAP